MFKEIFERFKDILAEGEPGGVALIWPITEACRRREVVGIYPLVFNANQCPSRGPAPLEEPLEDPLEDPLSPKTL